MEPDAIVATRFAHLHVGELNLVDPDVVDESNLSRLIGSRHSDIGRPKVEVIKRVLEQINPSVSRRRFPGVCLGYGRRGSCMGRRNHVLH